MSTDSTTDARMERMTECKDSYNDLVYLRARHYAPAMGRFLSRDTWAGDANHPLSFNRWNYTFSNPVNLTDPSGYFPPFWCQKMTSEYAYDECVSKHYKIEPINDYGEFVKKVNHGVRIKGFDGNLHDFSLGCYYHGPTQYRAKGYVEGTGLTLATGLNWYYALDSVYDFATMQHEYFITDGNKQMGQMFAPGGVGGSDQILGATYSEYGGLIWGFKTAPTSNIVSDYFGLAEMWSIGLSLDVGIGFGVGATRVSSFTDPKIRAWLAYRSISVGADLFPILLDAGAGAINMAQFSLGDTTFGTDYLLNGKINESGLYRDILTGQKSVWLSDRWPSIPGNPAMNQYKSDSGKMRAIGLATAMHYVKVYKELHWGFPEFEFPFGLGEVY